MKSVLLLILVVVIWFLPHVHWVMMAKKYKKKYGKELPYRDVFE